MEDSEEEEGSGARAERRGWGLRRCVRTGMKVEEKMGGDDGDWGDGHAEVEVEKGDDEDVYDWKKSA